MQDHTGRVVLVTGGASGIGRATVMRFAIEGASVAICDINVADGKKTEAEVQAIGREAKFFEADVTDESAVEDLINGVVSQFGRLDYAHNNAGGFRGDSLPTAEQSFGTWSATIALNLHSAFLLTKYELLAMLPAGRGAIVITTSGDGLHPSPTRQAYAAAKSGVIGLMWAVAAEYGKAGIRVNCVAPGPIRTPGLERWLREPGLEDQHRAQVLRAIPRLGQAEEIAAAVSWLCSDDSSYVNGTVLSVDGGRLSG
jgi:NAD(P)-dependent dehydrogenase (short-subunit alcohol dehydrogenase family)